MNCDVMLIQLFENYDTHSKIGIPRGSKVQHRNISFRLLLKNYQALICYITMKALLGWYIVDLNSSKSGLELKKN